MSERTMTGPEGRVPDYPEDDEQEPGAGGRTPGGRRPGELGALGFIRRHIRWVTRIGGVMFVLIGLALLTGWWDWAVQWLQIHLVDGWTVSV